MQGISLDYIIQILPNSFETKLRNLGIDLDNTIIDYSNSLNNLARFEYGISLERSSNLKKQLKDLLISGYNENEWTRAQGLLYSSYTNSATPYDGFLTSIKELKSTFDNIYIVSHKTRFPYTGRKVDIRDIALNWIMKELVSHTGKPIFKENEIFFESTIDEKIHRINKLECEVFIDDLPEVLFRLPSSLEKILFGAKFGELQLKNFENWHELKRYLLEKYR